MNRNYRKRPRGTRNRRAVTTTGRLQTTGAREGDVNINRSLARIPPFPRQLIPRSETCILRATHYGTATSATPFEFYEIKTNTLKNVSTNIDETNIMGFALCAAKYIYYRVLGYRILLEVDNLLTVPVLFSCVHSNTSITPTNVNMLNSGSNPVFGYNRSLQPLGSPYSRVVYKNLFSIQEVLGSRAARTEHNYVGLLSTPTDPTDLTYFYFSVQSLATNIAFGYRITISWEVETFDPKILQS